MGICLFQFLVGVTPFNDDCPRAIIANILNSRIRWPEEDEEQIDEDAMHVIKGLLNYDPNLRLQLEGTFPSPSPSLLPSIIMDLDLKKEAFFNTIDWENLPNIPAPFIPVPDNDSDTFYFEGRRMIEKTKVNELV